MSELTTEQELLFVHAVRCNMISFLREFFSTKSVEEQDLLFAYIADRYPQSLGVFSGTLVEAEPTIPVKHEKDEVKDYSLCDDPLQEEFLDNLDKVFDLPKYINSKSSCDGLYKKEVVRVRRKM